MEKRTVKMSDLVPFITSKSDKTNAQKYYSDAKLVRISAPSYSSHHTALPKNVPVWIDTGVEGFYHNKPTKEWIQFIEQFPNSADILAEGFLKLPKKSIVEKFTFAILDFCNSKDPAAISVPQIPLKNTSDHNKINREFAKATENWRHKVGFNGKLILPVIATNQKQLNKKTDRNKVVAQAAANLGHSGATGIWAVDQSLFDQNATGTFKSMRFPALIDFYSELKQATPEATLRLAGPYWGMGYVLWSRGLIDSICTGIGKSYQYFLAGTPITGSANTRIAIPGLYRWAIAGSALSKWIEHAISVVDQNSVSHAQFIELMKQFRTIQLNDTASRRQIAEFHRSWYDTLAGADPSGRQIMLFQQLSDAYVLGKNLKKIPTEKGRISDPSLIAEDFMMNCL
jgi:hypothetical protein